jgi:hypothetical protein
MNMNPSALPTARSKHSLGAHLMQSERAIREQADSNIPRD